MSFLKELQGADADRAVLELEKFVQELREAQLEYQLGKAQRLRELVGVEGRRRDV